MDYIILTKHNTVDKRIFIPIEKIGCIYEFEPDDTCVIQIDYKSGVEIFHVDETLEQIQDIINSLFE